MAVRGAVDAAAAGGVVTSVTGTAAEVTVTPTTGATVVSLPAALTFTGKTITGGAYVTPALGVASATSLSNAGDTTYTAVASGPTLKRGANGRCGTFVANGATPVTVNNTSIAITDTIVISLNTVGGAGPVGQPWVTTITAATSFTVTAIATDTSTYNYAIIKNAA